MMSDGRIFHVTFNDRSRVFILLLSTDRKQIRSSIELQREILKHIIACGIVFGLCVVRGRWRNDRVDHTGINDYRVIPCKTIAAKDVVRDHHNENCARSKTKMRRCKKNGNFEGNRKNRGISERDWPSKSFFASSDLSSRTNINLIPFGVLPSRLSGWNSVPAVNSGAS